MIKAFELCKEALNLYTDSHYIFNLFPNIKTTVINMDKSSINALLLQLQSLVQARTSSYFIGHLPAQLPGPPVQGNRQVDVLIHLVVNPTEKAIASHQLHHQNSQALRY